MSGFRKDDFREYRATERIHLGQHGVEIQKDDHIEYDGFTLKIGIDSYNEPRLRGAVKKQWLVPSSDTTTKYTRRPAGVQVRSADTGNPMDRRRTTSSAMAMEAGGEEMVVSKPGFTDFTHGTDRERRHGRAVRGMKIEREGNYDAVPVAKLSPLAQRGERTALVSNAGVATNQINKLDSQLRRPEVQSRTASVPNLSNSGLSPEEQAVLQQLLAKAQGTAPAPEEEGPVSDAPWIKSADEIEEAKALAAAEREARLASLGMGSNPVQSATEAATEATTEAPTEQIDLADILEEAPTSIEDGHAAQIAMVRQLIPHFEWDLSAHWKTRVKVACTDHSKDPVYLRGILMVETDSVKKYIHQYLDQKGIVI